MKWLIKRIVLNLFKQDADFRMEVIKAIDPEKHHDLAYGDLKNPPPLPSEGMIRWIVRGDI
jgi:hypothetical protein